MNKTILPVITSMVIALSALTQLPVTAHAVDLSKTPEERCAYLEYLIGTSGEGQYRNCVFLQSYYDELVSRGFTGSIESITVGTVPVPGVTTPTPTPVVTPTPTPTPTATPVATPTPANASAPASESAQSSTSTTPATTQSVAAPVANTSAKKAKTTSASTKSDTPIEVTPVTTVESAPAAAESTKPAHVLAESPKQIKKSHKALSLVLPNLGIILVLAGLSLLAAVYFTAEPEVNKRK